MAETLGNFILTPEAVQKFLSDLKDLIFFGFLRDVLEILPHEAQAIKFGIYVAQFLQELPADGVPLKDCAGFCTVWHLVGKGLLLEVLKLRLVTLLVLDEIDQDVFQVLLLLEDLDHRIVDVVY